MAALSASPATAAPAPVAWCGTDTAATDRKPDAVASRQIGVIYAFPAGGVDRFAQLASPIVTDLAVVDAWWRREDPTRTLRFDLAGFPSCSTAIGRLDLARVPLQRGAQYYAPRATRFRRIGDDLFNPPFGFANPFKKYLVYYDGPVEEPDLCGIGGGAPTTGPSFATVYVQACFADPVGVGALWASVAVHELLHALGAVPAGAPHGCADGHVCDDGSDLMFPSIRSAPIDEIRLDSGRDDYYGHSGGWFDIQDSGWLAKLNVPMHPLTVTIEGGGAGRIDSDLPGIECPPACSVTWETGSILALTATAGAGSVFRGWSGACSGSGPCRILIDSSTPVGALFAVPAPVAVRVVSRGGSGSVVSEPPGLNCADACTVEFDSGQAVRLRAVPDPGSRFVEWGGACTGRGVCALTASPGQTVTATFGRASFLVTVRKTGQGRVTSRPGGISCGPRCSASFRAGTAVRLVARAAAGWRFASWSGACRGRGACVVRATADRAVRATFRR